MKQVGQSLVKVGQSLVSTLTHWAKVEPNRGQSLTQTDDGGGPEFGVSGPELTPKMANFGPANQTLAQTLAHLNVDIMRVRGLLGHSLHYFS